MSYNPASLFTGVFTEDGNNNISTTNTGFTGSGDHNILVSTAAGESLGVGADNILIGENAGADLDTEDGNIFIGFNAGPTASDEGGTVIGFQAGSDMTSAAETTIFGYNAGRGITSADRCVAIGYEALGDSTASFNLANAGHIAIGYQSMHGGTGIASSNNIAIGYQSMDSDSLGAATGNIAIGTSTLPALTTGDDNTVVGNNAGANIAAGIDNICIGNSAGPTTDSSSQLFIDLAETDTPFIGGDMSTGAVQIAGTMRLTERANHVGTPTATFGELWLRNDVPNVLVFTDDAGTDWDLNTAGGSGDVTKVGTPVNNQIGVWTGDGTIEGTISLTWNGTTLAVGGTGDFAGDLIIGTNNNRIVGNISGSQLGVRGTNTIISEIQLQVSNTTVVGSVAGATTGTGEIGLKDAGGSFSYKAINDGTHSWYTNGETLRMALTNQGELQITGSTRLLERADHIGTPTATFGEIWLRDDEPNKLIFTDDAGTDFDLTDTGGDVTKVGTPVDDQVGVWTGDGTIEGSSAFTFDGAVLAVGGCKKADFTVGTTDATVTDLVTIGVPSDSIVTATIRAHGFEVATGDSISEVIHVHIKNVGGTTSFITGGGVTVASAFSDAGAGAWSFGVVADDTGDTMKITVTGEASHTIAWHACVEWTEA